MLLICGLANAADATEILSIGLIIPAAEDDLSLTAGDRSAMGSCIFLGMLIGGLVAGVAADKLGKATLSCISRRLSRFPCFTYLKEKGPVTPGPRHLSYKLTVARLDPHSAGRRRTLLVCLIINSAFGSASALSPSVPVFVFLRRLAGVGVGGSVPIVFTFLTEVLPKESRCGFDTLDHADLRNVAAMAAAVG